MGAELDIYLEYQAGAEGWLATPLDQYGHPKSIGYANKYRELFAFLGFGNPAQYDFRHFAPEFRGLPDDLSPQMRCYLDQVWGEELPCFTWLALAELQAMTHEFRIGSGYVSSKLAPFFGDGLQPYPSEHIRNGIPSPKESPTLTNFHGHYNVQVTWLVPFREMFGSFLGTLMTRMESIESTQEVRVILEFTF